MEKKNFLLYVLQAKVELRVFAFKNAGNFTKISKIEKF